MQSEYAMKERPILFSGPMVRALLAGTKTQTRRMLKGDFMRDPSGSQDAKWYFRGPRQACWDSYETLAELVAHHCRHGQPGDRLWVREAWTPDPPCDGTWGYTAWAGCREGQIAGVPERFRHPAFCNYAADWLHGPINWTPSIHMPRWASRLTLEITGMRVERLQDISEADAAAEGVATRAPDAISPASLDADPSNQFRWLWESINGPGSWAADPWVWVVEFQRINNPEAAP